MGAPESKIESKLEVYANVSVPCKIIIPEYFFHTLFDLKILQSELRLLSVIFSLKISGTKLTVSNFALFIKGEFEER